MTARKPDAVGQMATWSLPAGLKAHATASRQRLQAKFMSCYSRDCCLQGCHLFSLCLGLHSSPSCQLVNYSIIHQIHLMSTTPSQTENAPVIELIQCVDLQANHQAREAPCRFDSCHNTNIQPNHGLTRGKWEKRHKIIVLPSSSLSMILNLKQW